MQRKEYYASELVLCQTADGFSLHAPWATDEQIATGEELYLVSGPGQPTNDDYCQALDVLCDRLNQMKEEGKSK